MSQRGCEDKWAYHGGNEAVWQNPMHKQNSSYYLKHGMEITFCYITGVGVEQKI